ncbi:MAG TPA: hypothetical protein VF070_25245 [Streptosporangiaceae bacterium]
MATSPSIAIQAFTYAVIAICLGGLTGLLIEIRARARSKESPSRAARKHFEQLAAPCWPQRGPTQDPKRRPGVI